MKMFLLILFLSTTLLCIADPLVVSVVNTNTMILPSRELSGNYSWKTGTVYQQGSYCKNDSSGEIYWAIIGGTSTNITAPPTNSTSQTDGTVTWVKCKRFVRQGFMITNISAFTNYLAIGTDAISGRGIVLLPNSSWYEDTGKIQLAIYGISTDTNNVQTEEW